MGAFENAIREQETFESLLKLYKESRDQVAELEREVEVLKGEARQARSMIDFRDAHIKCLAREKKTLRSERDELVERYGSLSLARIMDGDAAKEGE